MSEDSKFKRTAAAAAVAAFLACTASAQAQSERPPALPADSSQAAAPAPESAAGAAEPALAAAASATGTPAVAEKVQLQDVVVTAQKRTSTAQKTAASITAIDAKTLEKNGVQTLQDLTKLAPGVSLGQDAAKVVVTMRGVSSRDTTEIGDPAVSISSDGFYIQRPTGLSGTVYDLERVEVLRGPQGTLYGRSATGGAINFITAKPGKETEGKFSLGIGNYGTVNTEGMVNLPLNDAWSARAAFKTTRHSGYRTHESPAIPGDDDDSTSARVHLQYAPDNRLKVLLTGQYTHLGGVGPSVEGVPIVGAVNNNVMPDVDVKGEPHGTPNQYIDTTIKTVQLNASYDLDFASLIYSAGYRDMHYRHLRDLDGLITSANYFSANEHPKDVSHEVRLVSKGEDRFKWQFGAYYFKETMSLLSYYQSYAVAPPVNMFVFNYDVKAVSKALFGQASYDLSRGVTVDVGLRTSQDDKTRAGYQDLGQGIVPQPGSSSSKKNTYHLGLNWQLSPNNLLYAKYSTGYKAGGFTTIINGVGAGATASQRTYDPETINAFEVGSKNQFFERRLQLNLSAYTYDYKDQQVSVSNGGAPYTVNAGKSRISGAELELQARPTAIDSIDGYIAFLNARFKDFCTNRSAQGDCTRNLAGNAPAQAPKWQVGAGYEHRFQLAGGSLTPRLQTHYESKSYLGVDNYVRQTQNSYTRSDAMLTYADDSGKWTLQGYVRNIENARILTVANANFGSYNYAFAAPRTFGVTFSYYW